MIERSFSADEYNKVLNHPSIAPLQNMGNGYIDVSDLIADRRNVLLMFDGGGFLFRQVHDGCYNAHPNVLPEKRGHTLPKFRDALHYMFLQTNAIEIFMHVLPGNVGVYKLATRSGFVHKYDTSLSSVYAIDINQWIALAKKPGSNILFFSDKDFSCLLAGLLQPH